MTANLESFSTPKWDIALEALAKEEAKSLNRPLQIEDLLKLARKHAIRFDDIMVTMFELVLNNKWVYCDSQGIVQELRREEVNNLYVNGRLHDKDVESYDGYWKPGQ